ncbi:MAG TPA: hypothetical protein VIV11_23995, partial [Kofleriaceae bacterium]
MEARLFKWSCLVLAAATAAVMLWMLDDMRSELKATNATVNKSLPRILDNIDKTTTTVAGVANDIAALRDLTGLSSAQGDPSLVQYADSVLDFLEAQPNAQIGLTKLVGQGLKDVVPVAEWVRSTRKESLWSTFRSDSKRELLDRLCTNKFGSA